MLIVVELGLYFGFTGAVSSLIDNSQADLWVTSEGVNYLELGTPFRRAKLYQVMSVPGVVDVQEFIHGNGLWTRPDSRQSIIQVVGFNPDSGMGGPWRLAEGSVQDLKIPDGVIIDRIYQGKQGALQKVPGGIDEPSDLLQTQHRGESSVILGIGEIFSKFMSFESWDEEEAQCSVSVRGSTRLTGCEAPASHAVSSKGPRLSQC